MNKLSGLNASKIMPANKDSTCNFGGVSKGKWTYNRLVGDFIDKYWAFRQVDPAAHRPTNSLSLKSVGQTSQLAPIQQSSVCSSLVNQSQLSKSKSMDKNLLSNQWRYFRKSMELF